MRNTKIVIDKEDWDKIASEFNSNDLPTVTEIQIDQSIEEISDKMHIEIARAKGQLLGIINGLNLKNEAEIGLKEVVSKLDLIQRYATSQQIIEQLRVKEKEDWVLISERKPLAFIRGEWDGLKSNQILVKDQDGNIFVAVMYEGRIDGVDFCDFYETTYDFEINNIIQWKLI